MRTRKGDRIRRGIFRDFPLTFEDAEGRVREVGFRLIVVTRDGKPEPHFTERHGEFLRIYAGDEDVLLRRGDYTYNFTYETDRQIRWFDGRPELNWNATGNFWDFPIQAALVRIFHPGDAAPVRWTAYTGRFSERGRDWRGSVGEDGALVVQSTRPLAPGEGLTVVVELPPGSVAPPDALDEARYAFLDYRAWVIGGAGLLAVLGYYLLAWHAVGRDPKAGTIIPLFHPPKGVSPALANYIDNWGGGDPWKAFTAAALSLAVRGFLLFDEETEGTLILRRTDAPAAFDALAPSERTLLYWVEEQGGRAEINRSNGKAIAAVGQKFRRSLKSESAGRHFRLNVAWFIPGLALSGLAVLAILVFGGLGAEETGALMSLLFVGIVIGAFAVPAITKLFRRPSMGQLFATLVVLAVLLSFVMQFVSDFFTNAGSGASIVTMLLAAMGDHAFAFALVLVLPLVNGLFLYLLRAPTREGRPIMDALEGLRLYLTTAESARLNLPDAPDMTTKHFETLLPYAVALGVERPWAEAFAAALARAHPDETDPMSHYHSHWNRGRTWSRDSFGRSVASSIAGATGALAASMPRSSSGSSGFSGGGGSGRGGGGGGGGGW